jgi:flagellar hook protein FlgE
MANTYYTSLSGMLAASYGLQNTSNNVSNMQTPGFKRTDVFYSSLGYNDINLLGSGVQVGGSTTNFNEGKYIGTNNASDLAIVGDGFFVVKLNNNEFVYTRSGEFGFDAHGILIDKRSGGEVQGYNKAGNLVPIHQKGPLHAPGKPSKTIFLQGQFIPTERSEEEQKQEPGPFKNKYENIKFEVAKVYDKEGKSHVIRLEFAAPPVLANEPQDGTNWELVNITWDDNTDRIQFKTQTLMFSGIDGSATSEKNSIQFTIDGNQTVTLHFGTYADGSDKSVQLKEAKLNPEGTKIEAIQNDGYGIGKQMGCLFNEEGQIIYKYDNGQDIKGVYVGLARFDNLEQQLIPMQDSLFRARTNSPIHLGRANQDGFGCIQTKQIESSNVDSTMEFAHIVVLQRMFQACSQIMNIDKQLLEELEGRS